MLISLYDVNRSGQMPGRPSQDDQIPQNEGLDDLVMSRTVLGGA
jgi:hypothetical protein